MPWMPVLLLALLVLLCPSFDCRLAAAQQPSDHSVISLTPDVPVRHRIAPVSTEPSNNTRLFHLLDIKPNAHYEVRVSFLGTVSAEQHTVTGACGVGGLCGVVESSLAWLTVE